MEQIKLILAELRKTRTIVLLILLIAFILYYYKSLVTEVVETKMKYKKTEISFNKSINNNVLIQQMLNDLMIEFKADRAYIFQFHNTIKYYDGSHKNHMSNSFEVCSKGVSPESYWLQNIPVSLYPVFLQDIMLKKMCYSKVEEIEEETTRLTLLNQGIKGIVIAPYFSDGQFIAFIGCDYVKTEMDSTISFHQFEKFTNQIGKILIN